MENKKSFFIAGTRITELYGAKDIDILWLRRSDRNCFSENDYNGLIENYDSLGWTEKMIAQSYIDRWFMNEELGQLKEFLKKYGLELDWIRPIESPVKPDEMYLSTFGLEDSGPYINLFNPQIETHLPFDFIGLYELKRYIADESIPHNENKWKLVPDEDDRFWIHPFIEMTPEDAGKYSYGKLLTDYSKKMPEEYIPF